MQRGAKLLRVKTAKQVADTQLQVLFDKMQREGDGAQYMVSCDVQCDEVMRCSEALVRQDALHAGFCLLNQSTASAKRHNKKVNSMLQELKQSMGTAKEITKRLDNVKVLRWWRAVSVCDDG